MKIDICTGARAGTVLDDPEFKAEWAALYEACQWGTVFQSMDFVLTWYEVYHARYRPIVVVGRNDEGGLRGLLTLAADVETGELLIAGRNLAEYRTWLAYPDGGEHFIESALDALSADYPDQGLLFLFIPGDSPLAWARKGGRWSNRCSLRPHPRGLMAIGDGSACRDKLRKSKRSKTNKLKRLGHLHLDRLREPRELEAVFDEVKTYQMLRMRAVRDLSATSSDPLQKVFYSRLMQVPGLVHATLLRLDDKLVSAQIHVYNRDQVLLGLITHSPCYAKFSPGELHVYMLGAELGAEGVSVFDLTPGGDYKDRYASDYDMTYALEVFFDPKSYLKHRVKRSLIDSLRAAFEMCGLDFERFKRSLAQLAEARRRWSALGWRQAAGQLKRLLWHTDEYLVYSFDLERNVPTQASTQASTQAGRTFRVNCVDDLLKYRPVEAGQPSANAFLRESLDHFYTGSNFYSHTENDRLLHYGWLIGRLKTTDTGRAMDALAEPPENVLISRFHIDPSPSDERTYGSLLAQMIGDASRLEGKRNVLISVPRRDKALLDAVGAAGFTRQHTILETRRLGHKRQRIVSSPRHLEPPRDSSFWGPFRGGEIYKFATSLVGVFALIAAFAALDGCVRTSSHHAWRRRIERNFDAELPLLGGV